MTDSFKPSVACPDAANAGHTVKNITTSTVLKAAPGRVFTVTAVVAGSGPGTVNDTNTASLAGAANQIGTIPASTTPLLFGGVPCDTGITVVPGTGQTLAVSIA